MQQDQAEQEQNKQNSQNKLIAISVSAVVLIALTVAAFLISQSNSAKKTEAIVYHDVAVAEYDLALKNLELALEEAKEVLTVTTKEDVLDGVVLDTLQEAFNVAEVAEKVVPLDPLSLNAEQIDADTFKINEVASQIKEIAVTLSESITPVLESVEAKKIFDLREEVSEQLTEAELVIAEGEQFRFAREILELRGAIQLTEEILADDEASIAQLEEVHKSLSTATAAANQLLTESLPKPEDINGHWCPAPDSNGSLSDCFFVDLPTVTQQNSVSKSDAVTSTLELNKSPSKHAGCFVFDSVDTNAVEANKIFGYYCPAGIELDLPRLYKGIDYPGEDRIWMDSGRKMWLRK